MKKSHTRVKKEKGISFDRPVLEPNAAGIDVGSRQMFVSVAPDRDSSAGSGVRCVYRRSESVGGLVGRLWCDDGGNGIDRSLLDSAI